MTRDQAQARAAQLNREQGERAERHWIAQEVQGEGWRVVAVTVPGMTFEREPSHPETRMRPRPEEPPDPRPMLGRMFPPYGPS